MVEKEKLEEFTNDVKEQIDIYELSYELDIHSHALRTLGALLKSSDLTEFTDYALVSLNPSDGADEYSFNLRYGINQIIDMYLEKQEKIMSRFCNIESDEVEGLKKVEHYIKLLTELRPDRLNGVFLYNLEKAVRNLDSIIEGSKHFSEKASKLKKKADKYIQYTLELRLHFLKEKAGKQQEPDVPKIKK